MPVKVKPIKVKLKNPRLQSLASILFETANICRNYDSDCSICSGSERRRSGYVCRYGLKAVEEARKMKRESKILTEEYIGNLDIHARNYTGPDAGDVFEGSFLRLVYYKSKKLNQPNSFSTILLESKLSKSS